MHINVVATALPGLDPDAVGAIVRSAWLAKRDADSVNVRLSSDGVVVDHVGTGLDAVFRAAHKDALAVEGSEPRRVVWLSGSGAGLIDLAESSGFDGVGDPRGSSEFLGRDILEARGQGLTSLHIHVPKLMRNSDVGCGLLTHLSGINVSLDSGREKIREALTLARRAVGQLRIDLTFEGELALSGVNGMARAWAGAGLDDNEAQEFEREIGKFVSEFEHGASAGGLLLLGGPRVDARSVFSGVGGGLGFVLGALGANVSELGPYIRSNYWMPSDDEAELFIYITNTIGLDIPSGLVRMSKDAESFAAPAIAVVNRGHVIRGELPRLGLSGLYNLSRADKYEAASESRALADESKDSILASGDMSAKLASRIDKLATTWGWD